MSTLPLVARFLRARWTPERVAIDAMTPGDVLKFDADQYFNVKSSCSRLNEAYEGTRVWEMTSVGRATTVTCKI